MAYNNDIIIMASFYKPCHQCDVRHTHKQKVNWFSQQFQLKKKKEKSAKYELLMVGTLDLSNCLYFVTVSPFDTVSCVLC